MSMLLRYAMTTDPFPLQASPSTGTASIAQLTLIATNATGSGITLQAISVTLPVGAGAAKLTNDTSRIGMVPPAGWKLAATNYPSGEVEYIFYPNAGYGTLGSQSSLVFIFNNIPINTQPGTAQIEITEGSSGCQPPNCPSVLLDLTKFPAAWGAVTYFANPLIVAVGGATTLYWSGPAGATYSIEYYDYQQGAIINVPGVGQAPLSNQGQYPAQGQPPLVPAQMTVFTLNVEESIGTQLYRAQQQVVVTVQTPQQLAILDFEGSSGSFGVRDILSLSWQTQLADSCFLEVDEGSGKVAVAAKNGIINSCNVSSPDGTTLVVTKADGSGTVLGKISLPPSLSKATFRLTAARQKGVVQQTFLMDLLPPQNISFWHRLEGVVSPDPYWVLLWQTTFAASVSIAPYIGSVPLNGQMIADSGTYTLTCEGFGDPVIVKTTIP